MTRLAQEAAPARAAVSAAELAAGGYVGLRDEWLGVYVRQEEAVEGRPMFKKPHQEQFIFFTTDGCWAAGADTSKPFGMWEVTSAATAPGAITEP